MTLLSHFGGTPAERSKGRGMRGKGDLAGCFAYGFLYESTWDPVGPDHCCMVAVDRPRLGTTGKLHV